MILFFQPPPPPGGAAAGGFQLPAFDAWQLILGLAIAVFGIAMIIRAIRGQGGSTSISLPHISGRGFLLAALALGVVVIIISMVTLNPQAAQGGGPVISLDPPDVVEQIGERLEDVAAGGPGAAIAGVQPAIQEQFDRARLDGYDIEHAEVWQGINPAADQQALIEMMWGPMVEVTDGDLVASSNQISASLQVTGTLTVTGTLEDSFRAVTGHALTAANRAAAKEHLGVDVYGEVVAHVETLNALASIAVREGKISEVPPSIELARVALSRKAPHVQGSSRMCEELTVGLIVSELDWAIEKARLTSCANILGAEHTVRSSDGRSTFNLEVTLNTVIARLLELGPDWATYQSTNALPTPEAIVLPPLPTTTP